MKNLLLITSFFLISVLSIGQGFTIPVKTVTSYGFSDAKIIQASIQIIDTDAGLQIVPFDISTTNSQLSSITSNGSYKANILGTQLNASNDQDSVFKNLSGTIYVSIVPQGFTGMVTVKFLVYNDDGSTINYQRRDTITINLISCTTIPKVNINYSGVQHICQQDSVQLIAPTGYSSYTWLTVGSYLAYSQTRTPWIYWEKYAPSISYYVNCYPASGCPVRSNAVEFLSRRPIDPSICVVSVDTLTGKNIVLWPNVQQADIKSYNIYKEDASSKFVLIGSRPADSLSTFEDMASDPSIHSDSYEISAVDSCDHETVLSAYHKTVHLSVNQGQFGWNLSWEPYIGFTVQTYNIYRGSSPDHLSLLASVSSSISSYSDNTPPSGQLYYVIEALNPNGGCTPNAKAATLNYTRSNMFNSLKSNIKSPVINQQISVYPNPSTGVFNISGDNRGIIVYDQLGEEIINTQFMTQRIGLKKVGIYFVKIKTYSNLYQDKLIVQ